MNTNTYRAPLALAIVALFATALVPISGAEEPTTLYTFRTGAPTDPTWTMLKLEVTEPGVRPYVYYETPALHCPMTWGTYFLEGTPGNTNSINSLAFDFSTGRTGVESRVETPLNAARIAVTQNDGANACAWFNVTVEFGELPVGTLYMLQHTSGVPFESTVVLSVNGPGVTVVGSSSGRTSFYRNESDINGIGVSVFGPPFCGAPWEAADCPPNHMNAGGLVGASAELERWTQVRFRHHPFFKLVNDGRVTVSNASVTYPDGSVRYARSPFGEVQGINVLAKGVYNIDVVGPPGFYRFGIKAGVEVGAAAKPGWHVAGADIWFPEEQT